jgi:putative PIN family toxin of toxin-antitoxin system
MRVVLDTNIYISAFRSGGKPKSAFELAILGAYTLVVSEAILMEIERVLRTKFGWPRSILGPTLERVAARAELVSPKVPITDCVDPDDNRILEAAVEGRVDFIVSGDKHLLRIKTFRGIDILTVSDFLLRIAPVTPERR